MNQVLMSEMYNLINMVSFLFIFMSARSTNISIISLVVFLNTEEQAQSSSDEEAMFSLVRARTVGRLIMTARSLWKLWSEILI